MANYNRICSVEGCGNKMLARGYCDMHYRRWRRNGSTNATRRPPSPKVGICLQKECSKPSYTAGYCCAHYERLRRHGCATKGRTDRGEPEAWLRAYASYRGNDCLIWPFNRTAKGYGLANINGVQTTASRAMCRIAFGDPASEDMQATHSCGKGHLGCVNPNHLRWSSVYENHMDKWAHGTMPHGSKSAMAKLTDVEVIEIRRLSGCLSQREIGEMFGVCQQTIHHIVSRKTWATLNG